MRRFIALSLAFLLAAWPAYAGASQREATSAEEVTALKKMAAAIPLGSRVKVHTKAGKRLTTTLMSVTDEAIVVKRESRMPEPAMTIRFDELSRLQRVERNGGLSVAKVIGIGLAAGAGAILTLFAIAMSLDD